jgi:hypothetical protein
MKRERGACAAGDTAAGRPLWPIVCREQMVRSHWWYLA